MASQDKLREMFNGMNTEQKGNFIDNLKKSLEESDDTDSIEFLDECIAVYNIEKEMDAAENTIDPEVMQLLDDASEIAAQEPELDPEITPEPEPELDPEVLQLLDDISEIAAQEPGAEVESMPEPEPELEPELMAELEPEPELEPELMAELEPELMVEPEPELEPEPIPEVDIMPEPELEPELMAELEPELMTELEPELMAEPEPDLEPELIPEVEPIPEPDIGFIDEADASASIEMESPVSGIEEYVEKSTEVSTTPKNKVDFIELEISELADNIRYKMSVIETISHLLSGTGNEIIEAAAQLMISETEPLESTSAYESKVDEIELNIAGFADSIRHDMKVMEAISNLLSGEETEMAKSNGKY